MGTKHGGGHGHGHGEPVKRDPLVDMGYETEDINLKGIGKASFAFFFFAAASIAITYPIMRAFQRDFFDRGTDTVPIVRQIPPEGTPLLQTNITVRTDTVELRKAEKDLLTTAGWVDKDKGITRIPVNKAMQLFLERSNEGAAAPRSPQPSTEAPHTQTPTLPETQTATPPGPGGTHP